MRKFLQIIGLAAIMITLIGATVAFAQPEEFSTLGQATIRTVNNVRQEARPFTNNARFQDDTPFANQQFGPERGRHGGPRGPQILDRDAMLATLADTLGLTTDELTTAFTEERRSLAAIADSQGVDMATIETAVQAAMQQAIDDALANGDITADQADMMTERLANAETGFLTKFAPRPHVIDKEAVQTAVADALGLTTDELTAARQARQSIEELAADAGVELADVEAAAKAAQIDAINAAVADGRITQTEADTMIEKVENADGFPGLGGGKCRGGGGRGHGGPRSGNGPDSFTPPANPLDAPISGA
ncbi:MAG TPA: hypothetical protein VLL52_19595 [Anaerolineae bacterium]|nr:hypothetical protein [Anaerolineae bacterium]